VVIKVTPVVAPKKLLTNVSPFPPKPDKVKSQIAKVKSQKFNVIELYLSI